MAMKKIVAYLVYVFACIGFSLTAMFFAVKFGLTNEQGLVDTQRTTFAEKNSKEKPSLKDSPQKQVGESTVKAATTVAPAFIYTEEWKVLRDAIYRDREAIYKASALLDRKPRTLVSILIVEQLRLYNDNREIFKTVFAPLKILGNQSQFSWGVMGIKQETAITTEQNLKSTTSPFYLGTRYERLLDFTTDNRDEERFNRLVNKDDRFYSYLYAAVILKETESQWKNAGYDISKKPEILATLFNIGFEHSKPNASPSSGGAAITVGSTTYSFGALAKAFYDSNELIDIFPR